MAQAVQELYPDTQITFGPVTDDGFYYDFYRPTPFSTDDFPTIEKRMAEIVDRDLPIQREEWDRARAVAYFTEIGEKFKAEWVGELSTDEALSIYRQGENWLDLCRGPHLPSTGKVGKAFKLMKLAGAYWRGDSNNPQLQRIYGTCWRNAQELKAYLTRLEEAEKRDHRRIGREMNLFHLQEEATGSVFWHPKGWRLYQTIESYMRQRLQKADYSEVRTPQLVDRTLWEKSGHWQKYKEHMFLAEVQEEGGETKLDPKILALKPMSCPGHVEVFRQDVVSYRDLPMRLSEFGACHRYEPSGALHGIMRVRAFTQDDAHIFCTPAQIVSESKSFCELLKSIYHDFGFDKVRVKFSDRPTNRVGSDETWDRAESALVEATEAAGLDYTLNPGEGAFYGPKLEFVLTDAIGRDWQCGTLQVDFTMPERLDAHYIGQDGAKHRPVMLHRAILGSFERFIGILIEQYAGKFPLWLAPTGVVVCSITDAAQDYAKHVYGQLLGRGIRAELDIRNEKINYKVRQHSNAKVPILLAIGAREAEQNTVSVRRLGSQKQNVIGLAEALDSFAVESMAP